MSSSLESDVDAVLRSLAQLYALRGKLNVVELLATAEPQCVQTDYDNWNGGQYTYALYLRLPAAKYLVLGDSIEDLEKEILKSLDPLTKQYGNEWFGSVHITLIVEHDDSWRERALEWIGRNKTKESKPRAKRPKKPVYDAFISHATEDKDKVVRPLARTLVEQGLSVWYDEFSLTVGDSLRRSIDLGLSNSQFGIVILSASFFKKEWTQYELDGLTARQMAGSRMILPIWHEVNHEAVRSYSPSLSDTLALSTSELSIDEIANALAEAMRQSKK